MYSARPGLYGWSLGGFRREDTVVAMGTWPEVLTRVLDDLAVQTPARACTT